MSIEHKLIKPSDNHVPHRWRFLTEAERLAASNLDPNDIDKLALQVSDNSYWRLSIISPVTWAEMSGPAGRPFKIDAVGELSEREQYDSEPEGFAFLATDASSLYFRIGEDGGWSDPMPFGRGEKGDDGANGEGVPTDGEIGQFLQKTGTDDFSTGWRSLDRSDVGLESVDNTSDADKPISTLQQAALNEKANGLEVGNALAQKANIVEVNQALSNKANTSDVTDALEKKANAVDVTASLALKAEKQVVNDALALKADSSTVNAALAGKLTAADNLSDINDRAAARANLGIKEFPDPAGGNAGDALVINSDKTALAYQKLLPQVLILPLEDKGDVHLIGKGAYKWDATQSLYVPLTTSSKLVGLVEKFDNRAHLLHEGATPRDGQLVPRTLFPKFVSEYLDSKVLNTVTEAQWQADVSLRTSWVANDGNGNFRVPDWNGKQAGSVAVYGGRGDGARSGGVHGKIQFDQMQRITGTVSDLFQGGNEGAFYNIPGGSINTGTAGVANNGRVGFDSARAPNARVGDETRVTAPTIVWGVYLSNGTDTTLSPAQVDVLVGQFGVVNADLQTLRSQVGQFRQVTLYPNGGSSAAPANIGINSTYILDNPFGNEFVDCSLLLFVNGNWGKHPGFIFAGSGLGASANWRSDGKIVVQTGSTNLLAQSSSDGNPFQTTQNIATPLPCKIVVQTYGVKP